MRKVILLPAVLIAGSISVLTAPAASAADGFVPSTTVARASWGYVEAATPTTAHAGGAGDAPVGTTLRGAKGARSFFTFDVARFKGTHVVSAAVTAKETRAGDCGYRSLELWRTAPFTSGSSWLKPPAELERLATAGKPASGCLVEDTRFDVTAALAAAATRGDARLTLELRVPAGREFDPRYARDFANDVGLLVSYNSAPAAPTALKNNKFDCDPRSPGRYLNPNRVDFTPSVVMAGNFTDPDAGDELTARYELWPVQDPSARRVLDVPVYSGGSSEALVKSEDLTEGTTYAWHARGNDGTDVSPWSQKCYFTVDRAVPNAPAVTSDVYRTDVPGEQGDVGVPGQFTFSANGSGDVVAYEYSISPFGSVGTKTVAPEHPGGPVTVTWAPEQSGWTYLYAVAIDRAGNRSPYLSAGFSVRESRPDVWSVLYPQGWTNLDGGVGVPGVFTFSPMTLPDVVEYRYRLDDGPTLNVPADSEGKGAATVTPQSGGFHKLYVRSKTASGYVGAERVYQFQVDDMPTVTGADGLILLGAPRTMTLVPRAAGVTSYDYAFDINAGSAGQFKPLQAGPDGTAAITWTPDRRDYFQMRIRSHSGTAAPTLERTVHLSIDDAAPKVTVTGGAYLGDAAEATFSTRLPGVVQYRYWFSGNEGPYTVPARADGTAVVSWTPKEAGWQSVWVEASTATGITSGQGSGAVYVHDQPDITSPDFPEFGSVPGHPGRFDLVAHQPGAVEFVYQLAGEEKSLPVGPDGRASFSWNPPGFDSYQLTVRTRNAAGELSGSETYSFSVFSQPIVTSAEYPEGEMSGAPGVAGTFRFATESDSVTSYDYTFSGPSEDESGTVAAGPDGTATLSWTPKESGFYFLTVSHRYGTGGYKTERNYLFLVGSGTESGSTD
ncbi:hypothetical protein DMA12_30200 [Amycolatopsis balhimycina DSM 5908]|uniref:DNRLRE domain-containing protein n=1 Tax=Amycolatopsis balhimycina DSM 5908 TaxID=1081091 RepID=A0A428W898_AMYBA|nr:hypothetical protein [Amycolatopsis balhimycina]RSM39342.1 hypothetical protein DMA12_30200 [Amycolatopsis balhimycina DSM 5908]